jgi:hypothetical protein
MARELLEKPVDLDGGAGGAVTDLTRRPCPAQFDATREDVVEPDERPAEHVDLAPGPFRKLAGGGIELGRGGERLHEFADSLNSETKSGAIGRLS